MHGPVERQGLEQESSCREGPESREAEVTFGWHSPGGETGLVCERVEVECGRVSGTLQKPISGQSRPRTMPKLVYSEGVLHPAVRTSSPYPLAAENPQVLQSEPSRTEMARSRAWALLEAQGCHPGWVQRTVLRAADYPSWCLAEMPRCTAQKQCSSA